MHKNLHQPYLGVVKGKSIHHPCLISEKRSRMKILMIDDERYIPVKVLKDILGQAVTLHKKNV